MRYIYLLPTIALTLNACSTMNESLQLGAGMGALSGAAATYAAESSTGNRPSTDNIATGAAIGIGLGLITSYFAHRSVEDQRKSQLSDQTEMYFGDLPPSPFIVPKMKKGGR